MEFFKLTANDVALLTKDIGNNYKSYSDGTAIYFDTRKKIRYLGGLLSNELGLKLINNYNEKPNKQAGRGKGFVLKEYILAGFIQEKYYRQIGNDIFIKISFCGFTSGTPYFGVDIDVNFSKKNNPFNSQRDEFQQQRWSIPISQLPNNWNDLLTIIKPKFKSLVDYLDFYFMNNQKKKEMKKYVDLLQSNKNLILTGAPGTGKTFLAKEIAKQIIGVENDEKLKNSGQYAFVQFHPSYDYTDFVEGLRPYSVEEEENIGFKRKDGIFKEFCKKALKANISNEVDNFNEAWGELLSKVRDNLANGNLTKIGSWEYGLSTRDSLKYSSVNTPSQYSFTITKQNVYDAYKKIKARQSCAYQKDMEDVVEYMKQNLNLKDFREGIISDEAKNNKYVFIIDEINRAEISKVFGELFFSIDPGYRGEKGKVKTQYANLQDSEDVFADGFFVPENVYIIGTMNDIDRSVESMDFAMRRRFAWQEVKAEERISMWDGKIDNWKNEAKIRMNNLNNAIEEIQSLSSAYHIGPAYFLKLENYQNETNPFDSLWNNHLEGVVFEYLRGLPDSDELISKLKKAYLIDVENDR